MRVFVALYAVILVLGIGCYLMTSGCGQAGTWEDDPKNWSRAFQGYSQPTNVTVVHSWYWRSPHFTYEAIYYFELESNPKFLQDWLALEPDLVLIPPSARPAKLHPDRPSWFVPGPQDQYDM